jgi:hypothetical protein
MDFWTNLLVFNRQRTVDLSPIYNIYLSPEGLIQMYESERDNIDRVRFIPGQLGTGFFGGFLVSRKRPIYEALDPSELALR